MVCQSKWVFVSRDMALGSQTERSDGEVFLQNTKNTELLFVLILCSWVINRNDQGFLLAVSDHQYFDAVIYFLCSYMLMLTYLR